MENFSIDITWIINGLWLFLVGFIIRQFKKYCLPWIRKYIIPLIVEYIGAIKWNQFVEFIEEAVYWAEVNIKGMKMGKEKFNTVVDLAIKEASNIGLEIDKERLELMIDSTVERVINSLKIEEAAKENKQEVSEDDYIDLSKIGAGGTD